MSSILTDINKTIDAADMHLWYNEEYIPFVMDHLDDIVEIPHSIMSDDICYYMAYIPVDYHPKDASCTRETCIEWLLNNDKIRRIISTDDSINGKYCYSDHFLEDSGLIARVFNAYWLKFMTAPDRRSKNMPYYVDSDSMPLEPVTPHRWTMKVDYSKDMKPELAKVYYPIS